MKKFKTAKEKYNELRNSASIVDCGDFLVEYSMTQTHIILPSDNEFVHSVFSYLPKNVDVIELLEFFKFEDLTIKEFCEFRKNPESEKNFKIHYAWATYLMEKKSCLYEEKIESGYEYDPINKINELDLGEDVENEKLIYAIINTAHYDGHMGIITVECDSAEQLDVYGFNDEEIEMAEKMNVGDKIESVDYGSGAIVVRIR